MFSSGPKSLFQYAPEPPALEPGGGPQLLLELTPRGREFFSNLRERIWPSRPPALSLTSKPARFWPDVFVPARIPWAAMRKSYLSHALGITILWALSVTGIWSARGKVETRSPFEHTTLTYYNVSEYLPPLDIGSEPAKESKKGDPAQAKQEIISIPKNADNNEQTIISPFDIKLNEKVQLPNIVAWNPPAPSLPNSALPKSDLKMDKLSASAAVAPSPKLPKQTPANLKDLASPQAVQAAPDVGPNALRVPSDLLTARAVPPPPDVKPSNVRDARLAGLAPAAVPPPPSSELLRRIGDMYMAKLKAEAVAPALPVPDQRAVDAAARAGKQAGHGGMSQFASASAVPPPPSAVPGGGQTGLAQLAGAGAAQVVSPPPATIPGGGAGTATGQLVALSIQPSAVRGPIDIPHGNRSGSFAAGPNGRPGAAGTPDIHGDGKSNGPGGTGGLNSANGPAIRVGPGGDGITNAGGVVVAGPVAPSPDAKHPADSERVKQTLIASLHKPSIADLARESRPIDGVVSDSPKPGDEVFGVKKYYTMTLNMPNLTSKAGTWIMRFAELRQTPGELTAPAAVSAVHPSYPTDLMRARVEGTVTLYAVIHADGTVGEVRVLHGVDDRLDTSARIALQRWRFRPATKNGAAVDLEAVVQIPFIARAF